MSRSSSKECPGEPLLREVRFKPDGRALAGYPFELPLLQSLESVCFTGPVTFFVGENGSGKSTLLEAIATTTQLPTIGGQDVRDDPELEPARRLSTYVQPVWRRRTQRGFYMRSADFFSFRRSVNALRDQLRTLADEYPSSPGDAASRPRAALLAQLGALEARYDDVRGVQLARDFLRMPEAFLRHLWQ